MAADVIIRSQARCLTVVHDGRPCEIHSVILEGRTLALLTAAGERTEVGVLTADLAAAAASCLIAVVVSMDGPYVAQSAQVDLIISAN